MFKRKQKVNCSDCIHRSEDTFNFPGKNNSYGCLHPRRIRTKVNYISTDEKMLIIRCDQFNNKGKCKLWEHHEILDNKRSVVHADTSDDNHGINMGIAYEEDNNTHTN